MKKNVSVPKNYEHEVFYVLAGNFMCLKEFCFPNCWNVSYVVLVWKKNCEGSVTRNFQLVTFLSSLFTL